jgi:drug/metabolite transporter (DMT)-like permease
MLAGACLISTNSILVKWAHVAPSVSAFYRMLFGGLMLVALLAWQRRFAAPSARQLAWGLLPALAFAIDLFLWHRSIFYVGPGLATLLANFQVFLMALAGVLLFRERLGPAFLGGLALAFAGLWLLVGREWAGFTGTYRLGVVYGVLTGVAYAAYMLTLRRTQLVEPRATPEQLLCFVSLLCAGILFAVVLAEGDSLRIPDLQSWGALLGVALTGQVLGWVLIARAMPHLPTSLVGLLLLLQPSLSFVFDVLLFARPTVAFDWLGLGLSLVGIFVASQSKAGARG